jgi:hypothetical protein
MDDVSANMKATDEARKEVFAGVVKQEKDEKTRVDAITKSHGVEADKAAAATLDSNGLIDYQRRNGAAAARDSLRFVDTENEDATGKKYGGRALA